MTENCKLRKGYIIRILQYFATKLWNITNFVMLFQAVTKFLSRLVEFKILVNWELVHWLELRSKYRSVLINLTCTGENQAELRRMHAAQPDRRLPKGQCYTVQFFLQLAMQFYS
jgi:hypothetical protein